MKKRLRLLIGPNGAGKSSLFAVLQGRVNTYRFVNADEIKQLLEQTGSYDLGFPADFSAIQHHVETSTFTEDAKRPFMNGDIYAENNRIYFLPDAINSYSVAVFCDYLRYALIRHGESFSAETVFSSSAKLDFLNTAKTAGYLIYLYCISTGDAGLNIERVKQRVRFGGHDVPEEKIVSRYQRCMEHFFPAMRYAYRAYFWDNSTQNMQLIAEMTPDHEICLYSTVLPIWFEKYVLGKLKS